jgi:hypothetical protein
VKLTAQHRIQEACNNPLQRNLKQQNQSQNNVASQKKRYTVIKAHKPTQRYTPRKIHGVGSAISQISIHSARIGCGMQGDFGWLFP